MRELSRDRSLCPRRTARAQAVVAMCAVAVAVSAGCARRQPRSELVRMANFAFAPDSVAAAVGDTIVFRNDDIVPHSATALDKSWDSGTLAPGQDYRHVVRQAGRIEFDCTLHPNMRGVIIAQQ